MTAWFNGSLVATAHPLIEPSDRGFTFGDGVFETIRIAGGQPVALPRHLARFRTGLHELGISIDWSDAAVAEALQRTIAANHATDASARLTCSRGPAARGLLPIEADRPSLVITLGALPPLMSRRLMVCTRTRRNQASPLSRNKTLNYGDSVIARMEAAEAAMDDAVLLNTDGVVAGATAANLFGWWSGRLITPPVADGALPGVMRAALIEAVEVEERTVTLPMLHGSEGLFLSNSLGLVAVVEMGRQAVPCCVDRVLSLAARIGARAAG